MSDREITNRSLAENGGGIDKYNKRCPHRTLCFVMEARKHCPPLDCTTCTAFDLCIACGKFSEVKGGLCFYCKIKAVEEGED